MSGSGGGYLLDLTYEQWVLVEPLLPAARVGPKGVRREKLPRRRIVDAIFYVVRTGCAWRQLPKDFPPGPPCTGASRGGTTTAPSSASTTRCAAGSARPTAAVPRRARG
ncbi:transposase [Kitasatospora sp. NPDC052896]|uniref:transposase n=1 Tax=Kitasatospora sp. NPDC052896 TaxID=3364061 RepID=UPI0037CBF2E2